MEGFEWDEAKSEANEAKHGISFSDVRELWQGWVLEVPVESCGESRFLAIGRIAGESWTAVCTMRGEAVRIISVRRSNERERSEYDRARNQL